MNIQIDFFRISGLISRPDYLITSNELFMSGPITMSRPSPGSSRRRRGTSSSPPTSARSCCRGTRRATRRWRLLSFIAPTGGLAQILVCLCLLGSNLSRPLFLHHLFDSLTVEEWLWGTSLNTNIDIVKVARLETDLCGANDVITQLRHELQVREFVLWMID